MSNISAEELEGYVQVAADIRRLREYARKWAGIARKELKADGLMTTDLSELIGQTMSTVTDMGRKYEEFVADAVARGPENVNWYDREDRLDVHALGPYYIQVAIMNLLNFHIFPSVPRALGGTSEELVVRARVASELWFREFVRTLNANRYNVRTSKVFLVGPGGFYQIKRMWALAAVAEKGAKWQSLKLEFRSDDPWAIGLP